MSDTVADDMPEQDRLLSKVEPGREDIERDPDFAANKRPGILRAYQMTPALPGDTETQTKARARQDLKDNPWFFGNTPPTLLLDKDNKIDVVGVYMDLGGKRYKFDREKGYSFYSGRGGEVVETEMLGGDIGVFISKVEHMFSAESASRSDYIKGLYGKDKLPNSLDTKGDLPRDFLKNPNQGKEQLEISHDKKINDYRVVLNDMRSTYEPKKQNKI